MVGHKDLQLCPALRVRSGSYMHRQFLSRKYHMSDFRDILDSHVSMHTKALFGRERLFASRCRSEEIDENLWSGTAPPMLRQQAAPFACLTNIMHFCHQ
jgi:hypothetical protein